MTYTEHPVTFECHGETLVGIVSRPTTPTDVGVLIPVGGPQYRAGSHRQFTLLARHLAAQGYAVLRFDYRGMGDSSGEQIQFEAAAPDIAAAIDALFLNLPAIKRVALWGLCDAASASLLYWHESRDPRIGGFCLLNPWVRSEASLAKAHVKHYYLQRLASGDFWKKLLTGGVSVGDALKEAIGKVLKTTRRSPGQTATGKLCFQERMAEAAQQFGGPILLILSEKDLTAREFQDYSASSIRWKNALAGAETEIHIIADADHTFSNVTHRDHVATVCAGWLDAIGRRKPDSGKGLA